MKWTYLLLLLFGFTPIYAQTLRGIVTESGSNDKMPNVFIKDPNTKMVALTDRRGNFEINTSVGHLLVFSSPGYISDTMYVTDMNPKRIQMVMQGISLRQVTIQSSRETFNPQAEYPEVYRKSKVYILSPSSLFGKEAHNARRLKKYFAREVQERHVDSVYNKVYVSTLIPLREQELEDFMAMYRPTYQYIMNNNGPSLAAYINDSYKKFMALPPDKRHMQRLDGSDQK